MSAHHINYKKIYFILLFLLVVSVAGPHLGIFWITLITAFGVAVVKANLVIQNFMHLRAERRLIKWMLVGSLALMAVFVAGVAPDVFRHEGTNWENLAAKAAIERGIPEPEGHGATDDAAAEHADQAAATDHAATDDGDNGAGEEADHDEGSDAVASGFDTQSAFNTTCSVCHGTEGNGGGPAGAALNPPPADFTDPAFWADRDEARLFNVIKNGASAAFGGSVSMTGWGATYSDEQINGLIQYIETAFRP